MKKDSSFSTYFANFFDRLYDSDLIIDKNSANTEYFFFGFVDGFFEKFQIDDAISLNRKICYFESL